MRVLVCGAAGYIGSHATVCLAESGHELVLLDNFSNSSVNVVPRLEKIIGRQLLIANADIRDGNALSRIFRDHDIEAVVHLAGLKAVGESCEQPLRYFENNISGTISLLQAMQKAGVCRIVFSSSATVYGDSDKNPIVEDAPRGAVNPYGRSKMMIEDMLQDICNAQSNFKAAVLRYFNPVGAHPSGMIGEDPKGEPNNLMPYLCQVAIGKRDKLSVFGKDYPTPDGTGLRDYLHVMDLARAHVCALDYLQSQDKNITVNLGTGQAYSVLEMIGAFEKACGVEIPYEMVARRSGDVAELFADSRRAKDLLNWQAEHDLNRMCVDAWRWQSNNPQGYEI